MTDMDREEQPKGGDHTQPEGADRRGSKKNAEGGKSRKQNDQGEDLQTSGGDARALQNSGSALVINV